MPYREAATAENPSTEPTPADVPRDEALLREAASKGKPPFNEVSVLFPLLTFYTVAYLGLIAAEFVMRVAFILPARPHTERGGLPAGTSAQAGTAVPKLNLMPIERL